MHSHRKKIIAELAHHCQFESSKALVCICNFQQCWCHSLECIYIEVDVSNAYCEEVASQGPSVDLRWYKSDRHNHVQRDEIETSPSFLFLKNSVDSTIQQSPSSGSQRIPIRRSRSTIKLKHRSGSKSYRVESIKCIGSRSAHGLS